MDMGGFVSQDDYCGDTAEFDSGAQNVELPSSLARKYSLKASQSLCGLRWPNPTPS